MRIDRVRVARVRLDVLNPLRTATGTHRTRTATLVELTTADGTVGWGENVAPEEDFYTGESASTSHRAMCDELVPRLVGSDVLPVDMGETWWGIPGWPMAKHALGSAAWDAHCRLSGVPLAEALGGRVDRVRVGVVVGLGESVAATVDECQRLVQEGYTSIKLKIRPGWDTEVIGAVRSSMGETVELHADANGSYGASEIGLVAKVCAAGLSLVEQPFGSGDLQSHARLAAETHALVGLDESLMSRDDLARAMDIGACGAANVKPARVGGFAEAMAMLETCRSSGVPAWVGGMLESAIGRAGALALATHPGATLPADLSASSRYFARDVAEPFVLSQGCLSVPPGPGLGRVPDGTVLSMPETEFETVFAR